MKIPDYFALVGGDDEFLADREASSWFQQLRDRFGEDCETEIIDGRVANTGEVQQCIARLMQAGQNLSLFGTSKVVWLRHVSFLADTQTGKSEGTKEELDALTSWLERFNDPNTFILISGCPIDRRKTTAKFFEKQGKLHFLSAARSSDQLVALAREECSRHDLKIGQEAAEALVDRLNGNTRMMICEIEKIATFLASDQHREVTRQWIGELVPAFGDADFFEIADAFYSFDLNGSLQAVRRHFFTHKDARPVLSNLQGRNRLLIQLRALHDGNRMDISRQIQAQALSRVADQFSDLFENVSAKSEFHPFGQNPWYLGRLASVASRIPLRTLISFQLLFIDAFSRLIDHPNEQEQIIVELFMDCHMELNGAA
jgi:DNA polymerase III subunit delta